MAEFLEKKIDTYAEFIAAIIQHNIFIDEKDILVHQWLDEFDNAAINSAWGTLISGTGSITEQDDKLNITEAGAPANTNIYSKFYLPSTYDILIRYKVIVAAAEDATLFRNVPIGNGPIRITADTVNFYIAYRDTGGTFHWWDGAAWVLGFVGCPGSADGAVRIKKTSSQYIITTYNNAGVQQTQASIAITSVLANDDICCIGATGFSAPLSMDIYWVAGVVNDKKALGRFTNIIDLGQSPINKGVYSDAINTDYLYDETVGDYYCNAAYCLRSIAALERISQGFKITKNGIIDKIRIVVDKVGAIAAGKKIWAEIWTDDGTGKPLALIAGYISVKIEANNLQAFGTMGLNGKGQIFYFNTSKILNKDTQYHLVLKGDFVIDGANAVWIAFTPTVGLYTKGIPRQWDGASWTNANVDATFDMIFGIHLRNSSLISRFIAYADWIAWKTLTSKADFEGYNQVAFQIDTATKPGYVLLFDTGGGVYNVTGYNQNDIDLGKVPTDPLTLSAAYKTPENTAITFEISHSDDNIAFSALVGYPLTAGKADLTAEGLHRYWRVKATLTTTDTARTPELDSWTLDAFDPIEELTERTLLKIYRYMKIEINFEANSCCDSGVLTYLQAQYRIAYELYIKRVKYKISGGGIVADMELSNK